MHRFDLGLLAVVLPLLTLALPTSEDGWSNGQTSNDTSSQGPFRLGSQTPADVKPFEFYLHSAIFSALGSLAPELHPTVTFPSIVIAPYDNNQPESDAVEDFVVINLCYTRYDLPFPTCIKNQGGQGLQALTEWSRRGAFPGTQFSKAPISMLNLGAMMTLREAFDKLKNEGYTDAWSGVLISKFRSPPFPHQDEIFMAFIRKTSSKTVDWIYLGIQSGKIIRDLAPEKIENSMVAISASNETITAV